MTHRMSFNVVQTLCVMLLILKGQGTCAFILNPMICQHIRNLQVGELGYINMPLRSCVEDDDLFRSLWNEPSSSSNHKTIPEKDMLDEIQWRSMKVKLEEDHQRRFQQSLKSKPRKLPYKDARLWVQANLGPDTKEEFMDMVANGNLRTPYIPKQPDVYYSEDGTWISWDHFLHGIFEELPWTKKRDDDSLEME